MRASFYISAAALALLACVSPAFTADPPEISAFRDGGDIVARFANGGSRADLLADCRAALARSDHTGPYEPEFEFLVDALQRAPAAPPGYDKKPAQRTKDETIRAAIYDLCSDLPHADNDPLPSDILLAAGIDALGPLVEALNDPTPSRSIGEEEGISLSTLLCREDLALQCIQRITSIGLYQRTAGRGTEFHNDPARERFLAQIQIWWKGAKGKSQADILRLWPRFHPWGDEKDLKLALLEDPQPVLKSLHDVMARPDATSSDGYRPVPMCVLALDPAPVLRAALDRIHDHHASQLDMLLLVRYGDKSIYQELAKSAAADPTPWADGNFAEDAAAHGKNWSLPILAAMLPNTKMQIIVSSNLSPADFALNRFQAISVHDFGYKFRGTEPDRLAAIAQARIWWDAEGAASLADKINEDHSSLADGSDLFASPESIAAAALIAASPVNSVSRAAVSRLPKTFSVEVQRTFLDRLSREPLGPERLVILEKFIHPSLWEAPVFSALFESDPDPAVRLAAGNVLVQMEPWRELATYQRCCAAARRVADDPQSSTELLRAAARILVKADSTLDTLRLNRMIPLLPPEPVFQRYLELRARRKK